MADAGYRTPGGSWVRRADQVPRKRRQVCVRVAPEVQEEAEKLAMELSSKPPFVEVTFSDLVRWGLEHVLKEYRPERRTNKPCITTTRLNGETGNVLAHLCIVCGSTDPETCNYGK